MEIGMPRPGSNQRTLDRRVRRKASKERKRLAAVATQRDSAVTELVTAEGSFLMQLKEDEQMLIKSREG